MWKKMSEVPSSVDIIVVDENKMQWLGSFENGIFSIDTSGGVESIDDSGFIAWTLAPSFNGEFS